MGKNDGMVKRMIRERENAATPPCLDVRGDDGVEGQETGMERWT